MAFKNIKNALFGNDDVLDSAGSEDEFYLMSEKTYKEEEDKNGSKMINPTLKADRIPGILCENML